jgi:hypothetical protein
MGFEELVTKMARGARADDDDEGGNVEAQRKLADARMAEAEAAVAALAMEFRCGVSIDAEYVCVVGRKQLTA